MAYIPDDRLDRKRERSGSAWDVFERLCKAADSDTGVVETFYVTNEKLVEQTRLKLGTIKNAWTELRRAGWVGPGPRPGTLQLAGVFLKEIRRLKREAERAKKEAARGRSASPINDDPSPINDDPSPINDDPSPINDGAYIGSRARSLPAHQPLKDQPLSLSLDLDAHVARAREGGAKERERVCECKTGHGSEFCDEERIRAARNMAGVHEPEIYAQTADARSGVYDAKYARVLAELGGGAKSAVAGAATCDHTCLRCFGTGYENLDGKGARRCAKRSKPPDVRAHSPPGAAAA